MDSNSLKLTLEICPSVNHAYANATRYARNGKAYMGRRLSDEAETWKTYAGYTTQMEMRKQKFTIIPREVKFVLEVEVFWKDGRHGDLSNLLKLLEDAMKTVAFEDDKWCIPRFKDFHQDKLKPRMEIKVWALEPVAKEEGCVGGKSNMPETRSENKQEKM